MLEQEIASIIKFVLDRTGNPSPYYWNVPEDFSVPAVYFPTPEIMTGGETFLTYHMDYTWFILIFAETSEKAYALGLQALTAIKGKRNLFPVIGTGGEETGETFRADDPRLKVLDNGAAQLQISWTSRRPYDDKEAVKMQSFDVRAWNKAADYTEREVSAAYVAAIESFAEKQANAGDAGAAPGTPISEEVIKNG